MQMKEQISKNFTLSELTRSDTANKLHIDNKNSLSEEQYNNLVSLCENLLQPIRDKIDKPIKINSGFRCSKLNEAVKGAKTSQHLKGQAVDMEIAGMSNYDFACWIRDNNFDFDQLILEFADNLKNDINSGWVHISYNSKEKNRHQCLTINKKIGTKIGLLK